MKLNTLLTETVPLAFIPVSKTPEVLQFDDDTTLDIRPHCILLYSAIKRLL